jgi:hypothetical protein
MWLLMTHPLVWLVFFLVFLVILGLSLLTTRH